MADVIGYLCWRNDLRHIFACKKGRSDNMTFEHEQKHCPISPPAMILGPAESDHVPLGLGAKGKKLLGEMLEIHPLFKQSGYQGKQKSWRLRYEKTIETYFSEHMPHSLRGSCIISLLLQSLVG
jgi:hypothetical protein